MSQTDEIVVVGHRNPDTDTVMAAIGYAWLLRERDKLPARAARAGQLNAQTTFALARLELEAPSLLADASPRVANVTRALRALPPDRALAEAWALAASTHLATPVIDGAGAPIGLLTGSSVFGFLTDRLAAHLGTSPDALAEVPFGRVLTTPCGEAVERDGPRFEASARIRDVLPRLLRDERDAFLVVDDQGRYAGVCVRADLFRPPRLRLILVDHNEAGQAVAGLEEAELLEVLDHHRLANAPTHMPIAFQVDPVGSCSTLVAERAIRSGLAVPRALAGALLSGQLSDTLVFRSPTTTTRDRVAAMQLAAWAFPDRGDPYEALLAHGAELLRAGAGLSSRTAESIVGTDVKEYNVGDLRFGVAQVEVTDLAEAEERLPELRAALDAQAERSGLQLTVLMVTDVVVGRSRLLIGGDARRLDGLPYPRRPDGTFDLPGVVSRKKQLLPALLSLFER
jgi:manganese-dependent inorganic pyrophosphatase